jgi:hypothetical protein
MASETVNPASRRALLTAGLGGLVAFVAGALGRPAPIRATDGDTVLVGSGFEATSETFFYNTTNSNNVLSASSINTESGIGVWGNSTSYFGVHGTSSTGTGVSGYSAVSGTGVTGSSVSGEGIHGSSSSESLAAVVGHSSNRSTGLLGASLAPAQPVPAARAQTGVYGYAPDLDPVTKGVVGESVYGTGVFGTSPGVAGVHGESTAGDGVRATSESGVGVRASSNSDIGVLGQSASSTNPATVGKSNDSSTGVFGYSSTGSDLPAAPAKTGVYGYAAQDANARGVTGQSTSGVGLYGLATTGYALRTNGRVKLDKSAGSTTITAGTKSKTVTPGVDVTTSSVILATLQGSAGGTTNVHRVAINATANTFTIYLTANATVNVKVGWILLS